MKKALTTIGLVFLTLALNSCVWERSVSMTITSFRLTNESVEQIPGPPKQPPISITVSYEAMDENNQVSNIFLVNGELVDGKLKLDQTVSEPTEVVISVSGGSTDQSAETTAVLEPDSKIEFVTVLKVTNRDVYYSVLIRGRDDLSIEELLKSTIKGSRSRL